MVDRVGAVVRIDGRVSTPSLLDLDRLADRLAVRRTDVVPAVGLHRVSMFDVLAVVRLAPSAEILLFRGIDGASFGVPVSSITRSRRAALVIDRDSAVSVTVSLDVEGWTDSSVRPEVRQIVAITFAEFVMQS